MFNKKKQYYQETIDKIQKNIWDMELRIITIKEIREGIRMEFDRICEVLKSFEGGIEKSLTDLSVKEKREDLEKLEIAGAGLNPETRNQQIRKMRTEWLTQHIPNKIRGQVKKEKIENLITLIERKQGLETDKHKMEGQMMGNWIEKEGKRFGGIDQEVEMIENNIVGAQKFQELIKKEVKKL